MEMLFGCQTPARLVSSFGCEPRALLKSYPDLVQTSVTSLVNMAQHSINWVFETCKQLPVELIVQC